MLNNRQKYGKESESLAVGILKKKGYDILQTNYMTKLGEIDIVAREGNTLVFVEVKARRSSRYGDPKFSITWHKQKKISMTALCYLKETGQMKVKARFDVVTIQPGLNSPKIEIIKNAFDLVTR
jgi:putative endonuclease